MKCEILFHTSSTPKVLENVYAIYTKGALLCVHLETGLIIKYPLLNVFSICHSHGEHLGSTFKPVKPEPWRCHACGASLEGPNAREPQAQEMAAHAQKNAIDLDGAAKAVARADDILAKAQSRHLQRLLDALETLKQIRDRYRCGKAETIDHDRAIEHVLFLYGTYPEGQGTYGGQG